MHTQKKKKKSISWLILLYFCFSVSLIIYRRVAFVYYTLLLNTYIVGSVQMTNQRAKILVRDTGKQIKTNKRMTHITSTLVFSVSVRGKKKKRENSDHEVIM